MALGVIAAKMGFKIPVALRLEVAHHLVEGCARGRTSRVEPPAAFGATKAPKILLLNPYHFPAHCPPLSPRPKVM